MAGLSESNGSAPVRTWSTNSPAAEIHGVTDSLSCSITSALARSTGRAGYGFAAAGGVAVGAVSVSWWMYRRRGVPMFLTIENTDVRSAVTAAEWVVLLSAILAFSPQTNTRHLFDALLLTTAASSLLIFSRPGVNRVPLLVGCVVLVLGFVLPPGRRTRIGEHNATIEWLRHGGPCWCLLFAAMTVLWTVLKNVDCTHDSDNAVQNVL